MIVGDEYPSSGSLSRRTVLIGGGAALLRLAPGKTTPMPLESATTARPDRGRAAMWIGATPHAVSPDTYAAFRGTFVLGESAEVSFDILGAHWFEVWLDGAFLAEGPYRFPVGHAEFERRTIYLPKGRHVIAADVRCEGVSTRMLRADVLPPFFLCTIHSGDAPVAVDWKALELPGYIRSGERLNPQFAWLEWVDTRRNPVDFQDPHFDDSAWAAPVEVPAVADWTLRPVRLDAVRRLPVHPRQIGEGVLSGPFDGPEKPNWKTDTDPTWYRRALTAAPPTAPDGVWRRYDLGQILLGKPELTLDVPPGAVVEIAYTEELRDGRVTPYINLSAGLSRNLDHFIARGGLQTFSPLTYKGGRFVEIHISGNPADIHWKSLGYWHRTYFGDTTGSFVSADRRLNEIWNLGVHTLRACAEDAVVDNPTRERGQWTGDALPSLHIAASAFNDIRLVRRAIEQSAFSARPDGLVAGLCPGGGSSMPTYAAQWFTAAIDYHDLTGDPEILDEMYPFAVRNLGAFLAAVGPHGIKNDLGWGFVDWGYPGTPGIDADIALNLHVIEGARSMARWCRLLGRDPAPAEHLETQVRDAVGAWLSPRLEARNWKEIGYHRTTLALRCGLIPAGQMRAAVDYLKQHILSCFPNNPDGPRNSAPHVASDQLITPYFSYYSFPVLFDNGESDFVLDQYRRCWGWGIDQGLTTQAEVFDLGWSHCHVWASSPTAQMTRYLLGLAPRFGDGIGHFDLVLNPGSFPGASGEIPFSNGSGTVAVHWHRPAPTTITYHVRAHRPLWLHHPGASASFVSNTKDAMITLHHDGSRWV